MANNDEPSWVGRGAATLKKIDLTGEEDPSNWKSRLRKTATRSSNGVVPSSDLDGVTDELQKKLNMRRRSGSTSSNKGTKSDLAGIPCRSHQKKRPSDCSSLSESDNSENNLSPVSPKRVKLSPTESLPVNAFTTSFAQRSMPGQDILPLLKTGQKHGSAGDLYTNKQLKAEVEKTLKEKISHPEPQSSKEINQHEREVFADSEANKEYSTVCTIDQGLRDFASNRRRVVPGRRRRASKNPVKALLKREDIRDSI